MSVTYDTWSKARLQEELRSRSLPDKGSTKSLRERLRESDRDGDQRSRGDGSARRSSEHDEARGRTGAAEQREHVKEQPDGSSEQQREGSDGRQQQVASPAQGEDTTEGREGEDAAERRSDQPPQGRRGDRNGSHTDGGRSERPPSPPSDEDRAPQDAGHALAPREVLRRAVRQVAAITGRQVMDVIGARRVEGGWRVTVEILDSERVPSSGDLLAAYEVVLDQRGGVRSIDRKGRYTREPATRRARPR